jgi:hypothetical protein
MVTAAGLCQGKSCSRSKLGRVPVKMCIFGRQYESPSRNPCCFAARPERVGQDPKYARIHLILVNNKRASASSKRRLHALGILYVYHGSSRQPKDMNLFVNVDG